MNILGTSHVIEHVIDSREVSEGWESNHQRLKSGDVADNIKWRLRDWDAHPNDPGWENGAYTACHVQFRNKVQAGDVVFDTVYPGSPIGADPVIRSAFVVDDASDGQLTFSEFVFLNGDADKGVRASSPRGHESLTPEDVETYLQQLDANDGYECYDSGERPDSIPEELWNRMLEKAGTGSSSCTVCGGGSQAPDDDSNGTCD